MFRIHSDESWGCDTVQFCNCVTTPRKTTLSQTSHSSLKMEEARPSKMSVSTHNTVMCRIPKHYSQNCNYMEHSPQKLQFLS